MARGRLGAIRMLLCKASFLPCIISTSRPPQWLLLQGMRATRRLFCLQATCLVVVVWTMASEALHLGLRPQPVGSLRWLVLRAVPLWLLVWLLWPHSRPLRVLIRMLLSGMLPQRSRRAREVLMLLRSLGWVSALGASLTLLLPLLLPLLLHARMRYPQ